MTQNIDPSERITKRHDAKSTYSEDPSSASVSILRIFDIEVQKNNQIAQLEEHISNLEEQISQLRNSSSWRLTRPLRQIKELVWRKHRFLFGIPEEVSGKEGLDANPQTTDLRTDEGTDEHLIIEEEVARIQDLAMTAMAKKDWQSSLTFWREVTPYNPKNNAAKLAHSNYSSAGAALCSWALSPNNFLAQMIRGAQKNCLPQEPDSVVYSSISGGYENPWPFPPSPRSRFVRFSDSKNLETWGYWESRPLPFIGATSALSSRWVKLHPHFLFNGPRWAVWHDSNILLLDGWDQLLSDFQTSGLPMGAIPHPNRSSAHEEIEKCIQLGKANPESLAAEYSRLGPDPQRGLWETGFCFFDLKHPQLPMLLNTWWRMIEEGTHRDQIYLPYALSVCDAEVFSILQPGSTVRSDHRFGYVPHKSVEFERVFSQISSTYRD
jgi:hypothetical protein